MTNNQKFAIIAPLFLLGMMYPIFKFLAGKFVFPIGWYLGLIVYWLLWGGVFSWLMIGKEKIKSLIRPQKPTAAILVLVAFPVLMSALYKLIPGMGYEKPNTWIFLLLLSTTFGNGFFEELLWRGVYMTLFPENNLIRIVWASTGFALWHYAPGSISSDGNVLGLMIGAGIFGFYLSYLAKRTDTIWWGMLAHSLGGIMMIL